MATKPNNKPRKLTVVDLSWELIKEHKYGKNGRIQIWKKNDKQFLIRHTNTGKCGEVPCSTSEDVWRIFDKWEKDFAHE